MTRAVSTPFDPTNTYVDLAPDGSIPLLRVTTDFWDRLASGALTVAGRMVSMHRMTEDWPHWERHPAGDELLVVTSGEIDIVLDEPDGERRVRLSERAGLVVPRGVWHRAEAVRPAEILFITAGAGTEHRPVAPADMSGA